MPVLCILKKADRMVFQACATWRLYYCIDYKKVNIDVSKKLYLKSINL